MRCNNYKGIFHVRHACFSIVFVLEGRHGFISLNNSGSREGLGSTEEWSCAEEG